MDTSESRMMDLNAEPVALKIGDREVVMCDGKVIGEIKFLYRSHMIAICKTGYSRKAKRFGTTDRQEAIDMLVDEAANIGPREFGLLPDAAMFRRYLGR